MCAINPFRVQGFLSLISQGCRWRSNPGLKLANAFGVNKSASAFGVVELTSCGNFTKTAKYPAVPPLLS